ncbi:alginate lyase family protein [Maribacter sp.]|uniref:alginate lyase family protein n=1 Tax=Maribacter sp. TaxID=1897614 RepID=UPI0025BB3BCF|nr:alginate lyase family protein [Maribacter sp.]
MNKNTLKATLLLVVFIIINASGQKKEKTVGTYKDDVPTIYSTTPNSYIVDNKLTVYDYKLLSQVKLAIKEKDDNFLPAYKSLIKAADKALKEGSFSVMTKKQVAVSNNKHDYLSLAPYWWPDPSKDDGLPWVRKDGKINPLTRGQNVDEPVKDKMINNVKMLSLAYFFSGDNTYAKKTKELLKVWFVDKETRMNPNLNYAQGVPGSSTGRCFGIIEFSGITHIITAIEILELNNSLEPNLRNELKAWLKSYLNWLQTSELGQLEKSRKNNHATLYEVQVVALLLFLNRIEEAKNILSSVVEKLVETQIEADGKQPHELQRTKSLTYSILNLTGLSKLAFFGRKDGVQIDIWNYRSNTGDLQKAYDYLLPFLKTPDQWPFKQLGSMENAVEKLRRMFRNTGSMLSIKEYCKLGHNTKKVDHLDILLYPCNR